VSNRRKHAPRQKALATQPPATLSAPLDKLVACLALDPVLLLAKYGEAAQYVKQLAEIKWNEKIQWNMGSDAADSHSKGEYLIQLISREYSEAARKLGLPLTVQPAPQSLTDREQKLWEVIRRGATGLQYCREVDNAGIAPPRTGRIWEAGSRKYAVAYMSGEPWRHWIQDEKSKTGRKAKLAGLASYFSSQKDYRKRRKFG
jgi:hypothetical protein